MRNRQTLFIVLTGLLVVAFSGWSWAKFSVYGPSIDKSSRELKELKTRLQDMEFIKGNSTNMKNTFEKTKMEFDTLKSLIPNNESYVNLLQEVRKLANKNEVEIISFSPRLIDSFPAIKTFLTKSPKHIERYPVEIRMLGKFKNLTTFIEEILELPRTVNIGRLKLESELLKTGSLSCDLVLYTYMFLN